MDGLEEGMLGDVFWEWKISFSPKAVSGRALNVIKGAVALCSRRGIPLTTERRSSLYSAALPHRRISLNKDSIQSGLVTWNEMKARNVLKDK